VPARTFRITGSDLSTQTHEATEIVWDGKDHPYDPSGRELAIDSSVRLHDETALDVGPIEFEVIRTKLWNLNEEHADTIKRVSGSPTVVYSDDLNTCVMTERAEPVLFGPYIQIFSGAAELVIKYTLENRSKSPGIRPGDIFLHNDCLIAGNHQMDICVYAPVFVDDRLFCWVFSSAHARDIGGVEPGSFCLQAPNAYHEPTPMKAIRIADADGILADAEDTFLRTSRGPHLLALELRSQIAGAIRARTRIEEMVERYGPATVKGVMRKVIDDTERATVDRLERLPDGVWTDVVYHSGALPGDREPHKQVLTLEKRGARLRFSNVGTDPEFGSINSGFGQFRAAIAASAVQLLAYDHRFCVGGVLRCCEFEAEPGTLSCASREAAVTGTQAGVLTIYMAAKVLAKMLYPDEEQRRMILATSALGSSGWLAHWGTDQYGAPFATAGLDNVAGGLGAMTFRDGVDHGGATFWPKSEAGDCESWEQFYPVIYLYRRSARNGGHGLYRGGHGITLAWVGHRSTDQQAAAVTIASGLPVNSGLAGGHWGQSALMWSAADTPIREAFADGTFPATRDDVRGFAENGAFLGAKASGIPLGEHDLVQLSTFGGGGFGDPLLRDPERVAEDLRNDLIPAHVVDAVYGVVLGEAGTVDAAATAERRSAMRANRLERARTIEPALGGNVPDDATRLCDVSHQLVLVDRTDGRAVVACKSCDLQIADADANYKRHAAVVSGSLPAIDPDVFVDPAVDVAVAIDYRTFVCPGCGVALDQELMPAEAEPVWDTRIDVASARRVAARSRSTITA
jgi:N-methylhydantoinase B